MLMDSFFAQLIVPLIQAGPRTGPWDGHMMYFPFGGLPMLLIGGAIIIGCLFAMRSFSQKGNGKSALDILNKRYANGEIDRDTYRQMKRDIEDNSS